MAKRRKIANTAADPTLPKVPILINGAEYYLCFDFGALAEAKHHFVKQGHRINVMQAMLQVDIDNLMVLFPCAIHKFHPELSFEDAQKLLSLPVLFAVGTALADAWAQSQPAPKNAVEANPQKP